jgi:hypothetical protein
MQHVYQPTTNETKQSKINWFSKLLGCDLKLDLLSYLLAVATLAR